MHVLQLQLAQRNDPVEESDIKDHRVSNKGAGDNPDKTYDEGRIAPTPEGQRDSHVDGEEDKPKDRLLSHMTPARSDTIQLAAC